MTLEFILRAAASSMIKGHHAPHSYSAHVVGKGYINNGLGPVDDRADYLRQLERAATSEIENLTWAEGYAEPGYTDPTKGVVFADWNKFPSELDRILERAGYATQWSDEWSVCEDCNNAFRTSPDSYTWQPAYIWSGECSLICADCASTDVEGLIIPEYLNDASKCLTLDVDLTAYGFERFNPDHYESGWFPGQTDTPADVVKHLPADVDYIFVLAENSQFYAKFDVWTRSKDWTEE